MNATDLLEDLLERTSRTFALTIPLLDPPLRRQVQVAYLLFRIADTLEDADRLGRDDRLELLQRFAGLLSVPDPTAGDVRAFVARCEELQPTVNRDYTELLGKSQAVFEALLACGERPAETIRRHLARTTRRMAEFVGRADEQGSLALKDLNDLRDYCYAVAGIVGEMLTELVLEAESTLGPAASRLEADAREFGEALQLTNILKDAGDDRRDGRTYVPAGLDRDAVFALAAEDLKRAGRYVETLHAYGASRGTRAFHALPVRLARATLGKVEAMGPGAKISREELAREIASMNTSLDGGGSGL